MDNLGVLQPLPRSTARDTRSAPTDEINSRVIWVDLEMSGLDVGKERIIEIAVSVTDSKLTKIAQGPNIIIHQEDKLLKDMDPWCIKTHGESGLTAAVRRSKISEAEAERAALEFVQKYTPKGKCPLGGNSIYMDKMFLMKYMPAFCEHLHYRLIDVSTVKELVKRWMPDVIKEAPRKADAHRATDDIYESIKELKYYQAAAFTPH